MKIIRGIVLGIVCMIFICFLISICFSYPQQTVGVEAVCLVLGIVGGVVTYKLTKGERNEEDRDFPRRF